MPTSASSSSSMALFMDVDMDSSDVFFDGFELSTTPLDSSAFELAARDLADPNAFFEFAAFDAAATTDSLVCTTAAPAARLDDVGAAFQLESDDTASLSSLLSHFTDSDSSGSTSDSAASSPLSIKQQQQQQSLAAPSLRKAVAKSAAALKPRESSRSSKKVRATPSVAPLTTAAAAAASAATATATAKRPRKHNRIEILKLREQVEQLQSRVAELQVSSDGLRGATHFAPRTSVSVAVAAQYARRISSDGDGAAASAAATASPSPQTALAAAPRSVWLDLAVEQYAALQQSQTLNRKLRDAVAKQLATTNAFQTLLRKPSSFPTSGLLRELLTPSTECATRRALDATLPSLFESVTNQFLDTDTVTRAIRAMNDPDAVFHSSRMRQDPVSGGATFELVTNTPVASHFHALALSLWRHIVAVKEPLEVAASGGHMKRVEMALSAADGGQIELLGVMVIRKFEQASRVVLAIASAYSVRGSDVVFRERAWVVVSDTSGSSATATHTPAPPATLFQTFYSLSCEQRDRSSERGSTPFTHALDVRARSFQDRVVKALGERMREHKLEMQNALQTNVASAFNFEQMESLNCPLIESRC